MKKVMIIFNYERYDNVRTYENVISIVIESSNTRNRMLRLTMNNGDRAFIPLKMVLVIDEMEAK